MRNNLTMDEVKEEARHIYEGLKTHLAGVTSHMSQCSSILQNLLQLVIENVMLTHIFSFQGQD